jgi:hypothetical protein
MWGLIVGWSCYWPPIHRGRVVWAEMFFELDLVARSFFQFQLFSSST